jgi:hypothetical protein
MVGAAVGVAVGEGVREADMSMTTGSQAAPPLLQERQASATMEGANILTIFIFGLFSVLGFSSS